MATVSKGQPSRGRGVRYEVIADAIRVWVEHHPTPDIPLYLSLSDAPLSLRELLMAVEKRTPVGQEFVESVEEFAHTRPDIGIDGVLQMFREPPRRGDHLSPFRLEI